MEIMKNWTIGKRLTLGFAGVVLITVCVSIYAFTRLEAIQSQAAALANDSLPGAVLMGQIAALSEREVALVLEHIKANDAQEVQKLDEALRENHDKLASLFKAYETTVFGAEETERFQRLNSSYSAYLAPLEEVLKLSRAQKDKEAYELYDQQLQPVFRKFNDGINDGVAYNKKIAETSVRKLSSAAGESKSRSHGWNSFKYHPCDADLLFRRASDQLANRSSAALSPAGSLFGYRNRGDSQRTSSLQC
jgi:CHASE3 domain sensor protein